MTERMIVHLARTLRAEREQRGVRLVHIASNLNRTEASLSRFELGKVQPSDIDRVVEAYAERLDVRARDLWKAALDSWEAAEP